MTIALYRVDDRLIHGQVVVGWGRPLGVEFVVLVDDEIAASEWERELYRMGVPPEIELTFATVADGARRLPGWRDDPRIGLLLTPDVATMAALRAATPLVEKINLGGIHHKPGRTARLPYIYLTDDEHRALQALEATGAEVTAQDLPSGPRVSVKELG